MDMVQDILSFLGKEFYQDNNKTLQIRFLPGILDNALGYLFEKVFTRTLTRLHTRTYCHYTTGDLINERIQFFSMEIHRRNTRCRIDYHTCDDREMIDSIHYLFNICTDPAQITDYNFREKRYRFLKKAE